MTESCTVEISASQVDVGAVLKSKMVIKKYPFNYKSTYLCIYFKTAIYDPNKGVLVL